MFQHCSLSLSKLISSPTCARLERQKNEQSTPMGPVHTYIRSTLQSHLLSQPRYTTRDTIVWRAYLRTNTLEPSSSRWLFSIRAEHSYPRNRFTYRFVTVRLDYRCFEPKKTDWPREIGGRRCNEWKRRARDADSIWRRDRALVSTAEKSPRDSLADTPRSDGRSVTSRSSIFLLNHALSLSLSRTFIFVSDLSYRPI